VRTVAQISVPFLLFGTVAVSPVSLSGVQNYVEAFTLETSEQPNVGVLRQLVKDAREYLEITQDELARMLNLSPSTVEKFEQGEIKEPTAEVSRRYSAVALLTSIYRSKFGEKAFLVRHRVHEPSVYFGGKSLIEFAASQDDGIFLAVATEMRKYA
jgi:transcriptional regulator with XRE-family HTH domain